MSEVNTADLDRLQAAGHFWRGMRELQKGGSLLTDREHSEVDLIESQLYDMVGGYRDCPGCETPTPNLLLDREGGSGECPRCDDSRKVYTGKMKSELAEANECKGARPGDFDDLLDKYQVDTPEEEGGMWYVTDEVYGTIASFVHEKDAFLFRLMKINIELNGK